MAQGQKAELKDRSSDGAALEQPSSASNASPDTKQDNTEEKPSEATEERPKSVVDWVKHLSDNDLSVLAGTLRELNRTTRNEEAHVRQLSRIILRDPNLTSRVLKVANSALYKLAGNPITTISRAIVVLGFTIVRDIAVSLKIMDSLLNQSAQDELMDQLANSYHAAMQAKTIARYCSASDQEEVFIAALLRHVGLSSFLSCGGPEAEEYAEKVAEGMDSSRAAEKVLGFDFERLTLALTRAWSLGDLLTEVVTKGDNADSPLAMAAHLGEKVSLAAREGWDSDKFQSVLKQVSDFTGRPVDECEQDMFECAERTRNQAVNYGAEKIEHLIPQPIYRSADESAEDKEAEEEKAVPQKRGDPQLQLEIINELNDMVSRGNIDLNAMLNMVMEGIHRGIGLDRVALAFVLAPKKLIVGKAALGKVDPDWEKSMQFDLEGDNIFAYALRYGEPIWMGTKNSFPLAYLVSKPVQSVVGKGQFFIAPVMSGTKKIGVFYADNRPSEAPMSEEDFTAFKLFSKQSGLCLQAMLAPRS